MGVLYTQTLSYMLFRYRVLMSRRILTVCGLQSKKIEIRFWIIIRRHINRMLLMQFMHNLI